MKKNKLMQKQPSPTPRHLSVIFQPNGQIIVQAHMIGNSEVMYAARYLQAWTDKMMLGATFPPAQGQPQGQ